jgi:hypothetical protein
MERRASHDDAGCEGRPHIGALSVTHVPSDEPVSLASGTASLDVTLLDPQAVDVSGVRFPRTPPRLAARRAVTEARDRVRGLLQLDAD